MPLPRLSFSRWLLSFGFVGLMSVLLAGCTQTNLNSSDQPTMPTDTPSTSISPTIAGEAKKAFELAQNSACTEIGTLSENSSYNPNSATWWFDISQTAKPNCKPACVVNLKSGTTEINWRCSGALPPKDL